MTILAGIVTGLALGYGALMIAAAFAAYRQGSVTRGAWITTTLGGVLLACGALVYAGLAPHIERYAIVLAAVGLYLISDAAYATGTRRPGGPRYSHHVARAGIAVLLVAGMLLAR